jgi:tetratricopeptide (TPR) repeat protein
LIALGVLVGAAAAVLAMRREARAARDGPIVVAVADFANQTGEPNLDGMSGLLITSLEQSQRLRVLTRGRLIELVREMGNPEAPRIDESLARAVGRKAGVRALLLASIRKLGGTYAAELRAVDPRRDDYLFTVKDEAKTPEDVLALIDRLSQRTRVALSEPSSEVTASDMKVGVAVTENLEAYRHYFKAKELVARYDLKEAVGELRGALEIDPRFALARLDLAWIGYFSGGTRVEARDAIQKAAQDARGAPDKEARFIRILGPFFEGKFAISRTEIQAAMGRYPEDRDVAVMAAEVLTWAGYYEDASEAFERAFRLAPDWDVLRFDQVAVMNYVGKGKEALATAEALVQRRRTGTTRAVLGVARLMAGDVDRGITALEECGTGGGFPVQVFLAEGLAADGRVAEALKVLDGVEDQAIADMARAQVLAYAGRLREGLMSIESAGRRSGVDVTFNRQIAAWYLAAAGRVPEATKLVAQGDFFMSLDGVMLATIGDERRLGELLTGLGADAGTQRRLLHALGAYHAGDRKAALEELRDLDRGTVSFVPYFHGLAAAEAGSDAEAVEALRRFVRSAFWGSDAYQAPWFAARARYVMARSLDRLGRRGEAREVLEVVLTRWKDADADLPLLAEMKALRGKLDAVPAAR